MSKRAQLTGKVFGKLTVLGRGEDYISPSGSHLLRWKCLCECGNTINATTSQLICNDLCQPQKSITRPKHIYLVPGKHPDEVTVSDFGIGHSDIRGFGLLLTYRSMVRRKRHRLRAWITVSCASIVEPWIA